MIDELTAAARMIHGQRYPGANVIFLAGSLVRGEGTSTSDLDLVVIFERLPHAYRESYRFDRWPVEAFVHDPETLNYFFWEVDRPSGIPSLPAMVSEGVEIPGSSALSRSLKTLANELLADGPPAWERRDVERSRYEITNLIDDLREPRSRGEQTATATVLYGVLANHYLRSRGAWSAQGKSIPRRLRAVDASFAGEFEGAFESLFRNGGCSRVISMAEDILAPDGGGLFEGFRLEAPVEWRRE